MTPLESIRLKLARAADLAMDPAADAEECGFLLAEAAAATELLRSEISTAAPTRDELHRTLKEAARAQAVVGQALAFYRDRVGQNYTRAGALEMTAAAGSGGRLSIAG
jgi:hypothetical protein